jgi:hypothetical protein
MDEPRGSLKVDWIVPEIRVSSLERSRYPKFCLWVGTPAAPAPAVTRMSLQNPYFGAVPCRRRIPGHRLGVHKTPVQVRIQLT